jgi:exopolysaccharide biosynthesis polyprenyl glycosylphosphotransferase
MAALAGTLYLSYREISRLLFVSFVILTYLSLLIWRIIFRVFYSWGSERFSRQRRVLILGAGSVGRELENQIKDNPRLSLRVVGFLDNRFENQGADILGSLDSLQSVTSKYHPDDVVIALPKEDYAQTEQIISELHHLPVRVWLIPDYFRLALHKAAVEDFAGIPMLDLRAPALSEGQRVIKRAFDLTITLFSLPFALLLMGLVALAIRLGSKGPILFGQQRLGENGRLFTMYKFRTMQPGADELRHSVEREDEHGRLLHKEAGDPRVTRVGRTLRRSSLDELPQLFNVLKGEMSLVGPRPELPYMADRYETWQRQRFAAPQGITGWWQVNGRSDRPMHLNTEDDLYYIQHYSLLLDIFILFKTITVVLQGRGAF